MAVSFVTAQNVYIPDPIFKNYLVNHTYHSFPGGAGYDISLDANGDGEIQESEALNYPGNLTNFGFYMTGLDIADLTGIEAFKAIKRLEISNNLLTEINVDGCTSLEILNCSSNPIESIVINNSTLQYFTSGGTPELTHINLSGCNALKEINAGSHESLAHINLSGCTFLEEIRANYNPSLTSITLPNYSNLNYFQCVGSGLTSLDLSNCSSLAHFQCPDNQLISLSLANGNPQSFGYIDLTGNPDLTCIEVDDVFVADFLWGDGYPYQFDPGVSFNTDCTPPGPCLVSIPDANFKNALLTNFAINTNGNDEIECTEAEAYAGEINLNDLPISDLTGIEAFVNITGFSSNNNQTGNPASYPVLLDSLDLSNFTSLTSISCTGNLGFQYLNASGCTALTDINVSTGFPAGLYVDLSNCTALTSLNLNNKNLNSLNLNNCTGLVALNCSNNQLSELNISSNQALTNLNCSNNQLTQLQTFTNAGLDTLNCSNNQLSFLYVGQNHALKNLNCSFNYLDYLDVQNNSQLTTLNCSNNFLNSVSANNNPALITFDCSFNSLTTLAVDNNAALISLNCNNNQLANINVSNNANLEVLRCNSNLLPLVDVSSNLSLRTLTCAGNDLPEIDMTHNPNLKHLDCSNNQLTTVDVSMNPVLNELICSNNLLNVLDLQNNTELVVLNFSDNEFETIDLQSNTSLVVLYCSNNQLIDLDLSSTYTFILFCDSNNLQTLNLANGQNEMAVTIVANDNAGLCVQVDNADYSITNWVGDNFIFDTDAVFSENCETVGLSDADRENAMLVYPNPTTGLIIFSGPSDVQVTNASGQIIYKTNNAMTLDLSAHPAGMYFIGFTDKSGQVIQQSKVVKE